VRHRIVRQDEIPLLPGKRFGQCGLGLNPLARDGVASARELTQDELGVGLRVLDHQQP
jgi:hypothetical protein